VVMKPRSMQVADYVMDRIARAGVRHVFLIPGGGSMYLVDALGRHPDLHPVAMLHEQGASIAAEAYGQFSGNLGVALVTTGPGGTNAMTGVAAAYLDSTPMLVISGQVKSADSAVGRGVRQLGFQEIDVVGMATPITKKAFRITSPEEVVTVIEDAIHLAQSGRPGPVWVDIPLDIQSSEIDLVDSNSGHTEHNPHLDIELIRKIVSEFHRASKPVLLVGNGVRLSGAEAILEEILSLTNIPVLLTWKALDFLPFDHPLNAGRPGGIATYYANFAHQFCDAYLAIGARLDMGQTGYRPDNIAPQAKRYLVDIDESELRKLEISRSELVCADAGDFLKAFLEVARGYIWPRKTEWLNQIESWKQKHPLSWTVPEENCLTTYDVVDVLSDFMIEGDVFVPGSSGACSEVSMQAFRNKREQRVFNSEGLGPMGFGIAASVGAWFVNTDCRYFSIDGDGGFQMNTQELEVAHRYNMSICWIVLDNKGYGSIKSSQDNFFGGRRVASDSFSGLSLPNSCLVANAYGIKSLEVFTREDLSVALQRFELTLEPIVIVAHVSEDQKTGPRVATQRLQDGSLRSDPLEELTPKITNMIGALITP
jgi:acetolactate synthase-1/2/3 large subunit